MDDLGTRVIGFLAFEAVGYLVDHPWLSQDAILLTVAAGGYLVLTARLWTRLPDGTSEPLFRIGGVMAGGCLVLTGLLYESLLGAFDGVITSMPFVCVYYVACVTTALLAIVSALFLLQGALTNRSLPPWRATDPAIGPAALSSAVAPAVVGLWLLVASQPILEFHYILGAGR